ncbi:hypothetical protein D3C72_2378130 [compost metagenome]
MVPIYRRRRRTDAGRLGSQHFKDDQHDRLDGRLSRLRHPHLPGQRLSPLGSGLAVADDPDAVYPGCG